jgi:hypothetical protein
MFLSAIISSYSQSFEAVDMEKIRNEITNEESKFFYPAIFDRYINNDTTLSLEDYKHLYYGHALQPYYNPTLSKTDDSARILRNYLNSNTPDFERVASLAKFLLRLDPVSLDALYVLSIASDVVDKKEISEIYSSKYTKFLQVILGSGDGKSIESAYKVITLADEYFLIKALDLKFREHKADINNSNHDIIVVEKPEDSSLDTIYFDSELFITQEKKIKGNK